MCDYPTFYVWKGIPLSPPEDDNKPDVTVATEGATAVDNRKINIQITNRHYNKIFSINFDYDYYYLCRLYSDNKKLLPDVEYFCRGCSVWWLCSSMTPVSVIYN